MASRRRLTLRLMRLAYAEKWLVLGALVGVIAGLFAYGFYQLLTLVVQASARVLGLEAASGEADLGAVLALQEKLPLLTPLVMVLGAAVSSLIVYRLAPEAEGHGTDAAVRAFHRRAALIPFRTPVVKALASALLVGSGGSGGVEGPSVQMGAGVGSSLARWLRLGFEDRRVALVYGMAAALSMLFQAPLGSAFFAVEVLYKRDLEAQAFVPAFIASVTSYAISAPLFHFRSPLPSLTVNIPSLFTADAVVSYVLLGVYVAPFSLLYATLFRRAEVFFKGLESRGLPRELRPVIGAAGAAAIVMIAPYVAGSGRGVLAEALQGHSIRGLPLGEAGAVAAITLLAGAILKILATSLSIGSGGSGGVFAPGLLAGSLVGLSYYALAAWAAPGLAPLPARVYAYLGMASFFAAAAKVPLATSVMVAEMGRNYLFIVPSLLAGIIARELSGQASIYVSQLDTRPSREVIDAEGLLALVKQARLEASIPLGALIDRSYVAVSADAPISRVIEVMEANRQRIVPIVAGDGVFRGIVTPDDIEYAVERSGANPNLPVWSLPLRTAPALTSDSTIEEALEQMIEKGTDFVVIVDDRGRYIGVVTVEEIVAALAHLLVEKRETTPKRGPERGS